MIYILIWFFLFIFSQLSHKNKKISIFTSFLVLLLLFGLRADSVGIDTINYKRIFNGVIASGASYNYLEVGWVLINKLTGLVFGNNFSALLIIVGFLLLMPIYYVAYKESNNILLTILIFHSLSFYTVSFNIMRQCLAISYVFMFYYYVKKHKKLASLLSMIVAMSFHASSIFALIVFIPLKFSRVKIIILQVLTIFLGIFFYFFIDSIASSNLIYSTYLSDNPDVFRSDIVGAFLFIILLNLFLLIFILKSPNLLINDLWGQLFTYSILIMNMFFTLHYGARIYNIFAISQVIVLSNVLDNKNQTTSKVLKWISWIYIFVLFLKMLITNANGIMPYKFV